MFALHYISSLWSHLPVFNDLFNKTIDNTINDFEITLENGLKVLLCRNENH